MLPHTLSTIHPLAKIPSLYPRPPLLNSLTTPWQTIAMGHMRQPAYEFSDVTIPWHGVTIFRTCGVVERTLDGISKADPISRGDIIIIPAQVGHSARWMGEGETILIGLDPALFAYAIDDTTSLNHTRANAPIRNA